MEMLGTDRQTLSACALATREFTFPALCCLGRHIAVNTVHRVRECACLVARGSPFRHVRSLDLGITTTTAIRERDWDDYLGILRFFARTRSLTRLWLSGVSFCFPKLRGQRAIADVIVSLAATVNELGLYSCRFSCYDEVISLIRAFPLCTSLFVRDCVGRKTPGANVLTRLPQHTLRVTELELTSSSRHKYLIDVSTLIEDAALDISSLTGLSCDMSTADAARHALMAADASPIERLQLACDEAQGFRGEYKSSKNACVSFVQVLADPVVKAWPLKSLTIGPIVQKNVPWCGRATDLTLGLPYLETVTILCYYRRPVENLLRCWRKIDRLLARRDLFPHLERLDICITVASTRLQHAECKAIAQSLPKLHKAGKIYFWGEKRERTLSVVACSPLTTPQVAFQYVVYW